MKTAKIIPTSTLMVAALGLALGLAAAPALADPVNLKGCHGPHKPCGGGDDSSGGGDKAFLFASDDAGCAGAMDTTGASFGNVSWGENILFDPNNVHVHFKRQLKDVDPGTYDILGNQEQACVDNHKTPIAGVDFDFPACEGGICTLGHVAVTVKQNHRRGRTSGVLRFPVVSANLVSTAWVRVDVIIDGVPKILHSPAVTMVLPPNVP